MKKKYLKNLFTTAMLVALALPVSATEWQATTDVVPGGRHYREINGLATGYSENDGPLKWDFDPATMVVFVVHLPEGHVRSDVKLKAEGGRVVTLNVRILHPASDAVIIEHTVQSQSGKTSEQTIEILPDTELEHDGWYRIEITSPNARENLNQLTSLNFQRESHKAATAANSMMAPAVHLWWSSTDPNAPAGDSFDWIYTEALIPEAVKQSCTYQMTIGSNGLYSGIQTNHILSDDSWTHAVIFSAWDAGDTDTNKTLPDYMRSGALDVGDEAYAVRFGGEGTGASLRYPEGQRWQTDHWVQMLMYERPDYVETVAEDGTMQPFRSTLLSYWYKQAEESEWHYFGTLRAAGTYRMEGNSSGLYSFLENWSGFGGDFYRRVYYRNGCMRSTASGKWYSLNHAGFGSTQHWETQRNSRDDYGHGVTALYDNSFYIESGGLLGVRDSAATYEYVPQGEMPWVDTINIQGLKDRVDKAVLHGNTRDIRMRIEATSVISDPATWKLISFSDEETTGEGEYGRAAQIMDGNTSSYYRQRTYSNYPHTFTFDAGEEVTVSSIGLYQSMDLNYRAKQMQLYVSTDGSSYTPLTRLTFDNDAAPTAVLSEPVTARYFRCRFLSGYGSGLNLAINEIYFKHEYRLDDLKVLAAELLALEDCFGGYSPEALEELKQVYADGNTTDATALREAIARLGENAQPMTWGLVDKAYHLTSFTSYQLHNPYGYGDLVATEDGHISLSGTIVDNALEPYQRPTRVTSPYDNWLILRSEAYNEYYIYNLGAKKYLHMEEEAISLSDAPQAFDITARSGGFYIGIGRARVQLQPTTEQVAVRSSRSDNATVFQLRNNYANSPADEAIRAQLTAAEESIYGGGGEDIIEAIAEPTTLKGRTVSVTNMQGIEVYRGRYESMPALPAGVYIISAGKTMVKKLIRR